ncbi:MAG: pyridoxamine 5'-phosphate oxidase family protein [Micromonosporaceae bacterium]|nr:pyridoxamine 5'-phosphate oxidase family protein [Micromonosporaceae bacterium]
MTTASTPEPFDQARQLEIARRAIAKQSFCVLATSSAKNRPQAVGIMYAAVDLDLYSVVGEGTIKVRNIRENPKIGVCIPVRKYPVGPPLAVQFQGIGQVLATTDPHIQDLIKSGRLKRITGLAALDSPGICFIRMTPHRRISTYGLGIPLLRLMRDVSKGSRSVELPG